MSFFENSSNSTFKKQSLSNH